jgi:hypothetical protein
MERILADRPPVQGFPLGKPPDRAQGAALDAAAEVEPSRAPGNQISVHERADWRRALLVAFVVVLGLRVLLSAWAALVLAATPAAEQPRFNAATGITIQQGTLAEPWQREDALWYEKIATQGYRPDDNTTVFLPLFPLLMRAASLFTFGDVALAGLLVSMLAAVAALALLYRLALLDWNERVALRGVLYLALFPTSFFLLSAFTESLFLALTLGAFWFARKRQWLLVALLTALASLTKVQGALLCLPLLFEYWTSVRGFPSGKGFTSGKSRERERWTPWTPRQWYHAALITLSGPLAALGFFAYVRYVVGDAMSWSERQSLIWGHVTTWPGETLAVAVGKVFSEGQPAINNFDLLVLALFGVLTVMSFRLRPSYGVQALTVLVPTLLHVQANFPLMSISRYVLVAFPCFLALAVWADKKPRLVHLGVLIVWVGLLLMWSSQFVKGHWVG